MGNRSHWRTNVAHRLRSKQNKSHYLPGVNSNAIEIGVSRSSFSSFIFVSVSFQHHATDCVKAIANNVNHWDTWNERERKIIIFSSSFFYAVLKSHCNVQFSMSNQSNRFDFRAEIPSKSKEKVKRMVNWRSFYKLPTPTSTIMTILRTIRSSNLKWNLNHFILHSTLYSRFILLLLPLLHYIFIYKVWLRERFTKKYTQIHYKILK